MRMIFSLERAMVGRKKMNRFDLSVSAAEMTMKHFPSQRK
jgi:hypothetical protein